MLKRWDNLKIPYLWFEIWKYNFIFYIWKLHFLIYEKTVSNRDLLFLNVAVKCEKILELGIWNFVRSKKKGIWNFIKFGKEFCFLFFFNKVMPSVKFWFANWLDSAKCISITQTAPMQLKFSFKKCKITANITQCLLQAYSKHISTYLKVLQNLL